MVVFDFDAMNLIPKKCIVSSRSECDTTIEINKKKYELPIFPSNMECVINTELAIQLAKAGYLYSMHRFGDTVQFAKKMKEEGLPISISIGVNEDSRILLRRLKDDGIHLDILTIDIAHGHAVKMKSMIEYVRSLYPEVYLIAGNVSTADAVRDLEAWGANVIKVGIGPGCFKGDTRILMANGIYKNIKDIIEGEYVINKDGKPVKVIHVVNQGWRPVMKIRNNLFYKDTYVTKDHKFWIGDVLEKESKTDSMSSNYRWENIGECDFEKTFVLFPGTIEWSLPEFFSIDLEDNFVSGNLLSSYELGYIFGNYLGDKTAHCDAGVTRWTFREDEFDRCKKLASCIQTLLNVDVFPKKVENNSVYIVSLNNKCFARILCDFGERSDKYLPEKYYCKRKDYIQGLLDGLMKECRVDENMNPRLVELFQWCCLNVGSGSFTKDYVYSNILEHDINTREEETWDIEVDCETHSFIAENMIVHNSACTTYPATGFGSRGCQASVIRDCAKALVFKNTRLCADGGIREPGDISKALVLGADLVMVGGMMSGFLDSPGTTVSVGGKTYKEFWGSASHFQSNKSSRIEGTKNLIEMKPQTLLEYYGYLKECLQSSISYAGGTDLSSLKDVDYLVK
jgi:IMP dehydrogenase/GMP reductase